MAAANALGAPPRPQQPTWPAYPWPRCPQCRNAALGHQPGPLVGQVLGCFLCGGEWATWSGLAGQGWIKTYTALCAEARAAGLPPPPPPVHDIPGYLDKDGMWHHGAHHRRRSLASRKGAA